MGCKQFVEMGNVTKVVAKLSSQWFTIFNWKNEYWKSWKLVANLLDKKEYVVHIRNLKQAQIMDYYWKRYIESLNSVKKRG